MATLTVYDQTGKQVGTHEIDVTQLAPSINRQLLHDVVVMYQANLRLGTHKTKSRAEVAGSTRKLYRQKGTGNARAGSRRAGNRVGGGHIHAKRPRDYSYRLPRKAIRSAARMALASKIRDDQIVLLDQLQMEEPKTKTVAAILQALGLGGIKTLIATEQLDHNVYRSARNIERVEIEPVGDLNAYRILRPTKIVMTTAALDALQARLLGGAPEPIATS